MAGTIAEARISNGRGDLNEQRLTFLRFSRIKLGTRKGRKNPLRIPYDWFQCICGNQIEVKRSSVKQGNTKSCGCLRREIGREKMKFINDNDLRTPPPPNYENRNGVGKNGKPKGCSGMVKIIDEEGNKKYVKFERVVAMFYGIDGEVHSLKTKETHNKGKKLLNGKFQ